MPNNKKSNKAKNAVRKAKREADYAKKVVEPRIIIKRNCVITLPNSEYHRVIGTLPITLGEWSGRGVGCNKKN